MAAYQLHALARIALALAAAAVSGQPRASAAADGGGGKQAAGACAAGPALMPGTRGEEIQALYEQFECHFSRAEYLESLPFLERACRLTSSPRCLLNLGAVHHALLHCDGARSYYEQFLDQAPYDEEQSDARRALQEIRAACPAGEAAVKPSEPARPPPADVILPLGSVRFGPESPAGLAPPQLGGPAPATAKSESADSSDSSADRRLLAWSLLGAGGAAALATAIVAGYGMRAESDFDSRNRDDGELGLADDAELRAIDQRGQSYNQLMVGLGVASGLLLAAGTTLWVIELGADSRLSVTGGESALVRYRGRF